MHIIDQWIERRRNRAAGRTLSELSPHILADIGITPHALDNLRRGRSHRAR
ncbi:DUF1127 domain-containing protein [Devosia sp. Root436]|uniref:DUF1127 domain-containing protein n=1 Tax=Devosia sp. Root436 TaxID=1736537 RepID=UPI0009E6B46A|nr:DUF1127 domain-containing protein [Devosia sp. Root436]